MARHLFHVFHDHDGVLEHVVIDTLENIALLRAVLGAVTGAVCGVNVPVAQLLAVQKLAVNGKQVADTRNALRQRAYIQFTQRHCMSILRLKRLNAGYVPF